MQYILLIYIASVAGCYFGYSWVYKHYREVMERDLGPTTDPEILFRIASFIPIVNTIVTVLILYGMAVHYFTPIEEEKKDPNKVTKDDLRP